MQGGWGDPCRVWVRVFGPQALRGLHCSGIGFFFLLFLVAMEVMLNPDGLILVDLGYAGPQDGPSV